MYPNHHDLNRLLATIARILLDRRNWEKDLLPLSVVLLRPFGCLQLSLYSLPFSIQTRICDCDEYGGFFTIENENVPFGKRYSTFWREIIGWANITPLEAHVSSYTWQIENYFSNPTHFYMPSKFLILL